MHSARIFMLLASLSNSLLASPVQRNSNTDPRSNPNYGPVPGESLLYNEYGGKAAPFPGNETAPIAATTKGPRGPDDELFQNLLSAEWAVFSFYQQGVEAFNKSSFVAAGFPNTTYQRITEIRDNEAGHLRIFQDSISSNSLKPGACKYKYRFSDPTSYLIIQNIIEVSSMAFLTGLVQQAQTNVTKGALMAIGEVEARHETWALVDVWNANPFSGPSDTVYPYANHILDLVGSDFIVPGSCPPENPPYPYPTQHLPKLGLNPNTTTGHPGSPITFMYENQSMVPTFQASMEYYAVFFHGVQNITMPFNTKTNSSTIPAAFDAGRGIIVAVIADTPGAPTLDSVVAGPLILLQQPASLTLISAD